MIHQPANGRDHKEVMEVDDIPSSWLMLIA